MLEAMGIGGLTALDWLDSPDPAGIEHAAALLRLLGAEGPLAKEMARYPLHPRLARLIVESRRRGVAEDGCTAAAILSAGPRLPAGPEHESRSDVLALMEAEWEPHTARTVRQVRRIVNPPKQRGRDEDALLISILAAFPDRVARRRQGPELQMAAGGAASLAPSTTVTGAEFLVAVEAEDRRDQKSPLVRIASAIQPEWLIDLFPDRVREVSELEWNRAAERVESSSALLFDQIAIERSRGTPDPEAAAAAAGAKSRGSRPGALRGPRGNRGLQRPRPLRRNPRCGSRSSLVLARLGPQELRGTGSRDARRRPAPRFGTADYRRPIEGNWKRPLPNAFAFPEGASCACTTKTASRPGSPPACRISSVCARPPQ